MPPQVAQTVGPQNHRQRPTNKCGSLNVEMVVVWTVVDAFCGPTVCATTGGADTCSTKTSTTAHKNCGSLTVDMVVVWTVVDAFCEPTVCATTGGADSWSTKPSTTAHKKCGSLNVHMVVVWTVVDA